MYKKPKISIKISNTVVLMWGRPTDWRTVPLEQEGDQEKAPEVIALLGSLAVEHGLQRILSPTVSDFNSIFLDDAQQHPWKLTLPETACKLHRGLHGDGFEIHPGDAGIIAPADCAVIVVTTPSGRVLMLHAGRDSLIDRKKIETGTKSKAHESIIFAAWRELYRVDSRDALESKWHILPSISAGDHFKHDWDDERWGKDNEAVITWLVKKYRHCIEGHPSLGMINIPAIIASQLTEYCGVNPQNIIGTGRCTYKEVDTAGKHVWHSNARARHIGDDLGARNLVVVINNKK